MDARVYLDPHLIWQPTESYVERGDAFGLIPHELTPNPVLLTTEAVYSLSTAAGESAISESRFSAKFRPRNRVHRDHDTAMDQNQVLHIGRVDFRNDNRLFGIKREDRFSHIYVLGKTGTGKSTLIETMALQDVERGNGFALIDPHGDLVARIAARIPASQRDRVISQHN